MQAGSVPQAPELNDENASGPSGPRAGFWRRFGASLIDGILTGAVIGVLAQVIDNNAATALLYLVGLLYYVLLEGSASGQTLGKRALGIRVIGINDGASIGYGRALIRYLGRIVSSLVFLLGYLWMLWDKEKQTWHDKFASSVVVPVAAYPVAQG
jgi:uncharacterized RDD family membrane protein YckC